MIESIMRMAETHLKRLNNRRRETCSAVDLVIGVQCGGSDAFSGLTANPAVGFATDLLVRAGATVMFSEVTEVRDGVAQITARAASGEVAAAIIREMQWYDDYLKRGGADRSANTTPENKKGGLSNIVEKAMGSIVKSGSSTISGVLSPGEKVKQKGLIYAATPASDFICGTLQLVAGINLHVHALPDLRHLQHDREPDSRSRVMSVGMTFALIIASIDLLVGSVLALGYRS